MESISFRNNASSASVPRRIAASFFYLSHIFVTMLVGLGWLAPWDAVLWSVVVVYCATEILWLTRDGYCILTDIERWLLGIEKPKSALQQNFIQRLLLSWTGKSFTPQNSRNLTVIWGRLSLSICIVRLYSPWF